MSNNILTIDAPKASEEAGQRSARQYAAEYAQRIQDSEPFYIVNGRRDLRFTRSEAIQVGMQLLLKGQPCVQIEWGIEDLNGDVIMASGIGFAK